MLFSGGEFAKKKGSGREELVRARVSLLRELARSRDWRSKAVLNLRTLTWLLSLFLPDVFSPSVESTSVPSQLDPLPFSFQQLRSGPASHFFVSLVFVRITRGSHMVPLLNTFNLDCSVAGNHDFGELLLLLFLCSTEVAPPIRARREQS